MFVLQFFPHISFQAQAAESFGETLWTGGRRSVLQTPDTFCGGTLGHYHRIVQRLSRSPFEVAGLAVPCGSAPFVVDKGWAGQPWKENGENEINCKSGVRNLRGPVFAQPLAFARPRLQKFFDFCVQIYFFLCSLTDPTTLVTVGPLTPAGHLAIPLLWGKLFRQKFCVFTYFGSLSLHYISKAIISLLRLLVWRGWHSATLLKHLWPRLIFFSYFFLPARSFAFLETTIYIWVWEVCKTGQGRFGV